jgi:nucleotide-binding universal stress UspA family protein
MAKRFLVPLARSADGDHVIPFIADAARAAGVTVRLLHVAPVPDNVVTAQGRTVAFADQEVDTAVRFGDPVEEILSEAEAFDADVIAVVTTCRSGVKRALLGSVAEQLPGKAAATVLPIRPTEGPGNVGR